VIYPVGDPIYIHIYTDPRSKNIVYHPVEPRLTENKEEILNHVEKELALRIDEDAVFNSSEEKAEFLYGLLEEIVVKGRETRIEQKRIVVDPPTYEKLKYEIYCEKVGHGILEPFIKDPYIEDVHCSGVGPIFLSHKIFGSVETTVKLNTQEELDRFIIKLSELVGKPVSHRNPIIDATLPDGSRINIVFGEDVSRRGSNFTIRKFAQKPLSIIELIKYGTMSSLVAAYLWILLEEKMSIWVCGETASGKTTTLSAITSFIPPSAKIVSIEEVPEVHVPHRNWIREVVRETGNAASDEQGAVSMFQLLKAALRQRPTYIIVGEIRGVEGNIAFQAMQTGHPVLSTFHAASVGKLIQRLTNYPINVPKTHVDNLNVAIFQSAVHDPETGRYKRRVLNVNEILGYEPADQQFNFIEVFSYNPIFDNFEFRGLGTSYLLDSKIAIMRGLSGYEIRKIYEELYQRSEILEYMLKLGITDYWEVWENLSWINRVGIEKAYHKYKRMCLMKFGSKVEDVIKAKIGRFL
ncbi:hypothetical protein DRO58_09325, partial [Candidatus Bathyarchaeota archaeon]